MLRRIAIAITLLGSSGCAIVERLDETNQRLATVNAQLNETNQRLDGALQRLDQANGQLGETNRRIDVLDQAVMRFPGLRPDPTPTNPNPTNPAAAPR